MQGVSKYCHVRAAWGRTGGGGRGGGGDAASTGTLNTCSNMQAFEGGRDKGGEWRGPQNKSNYRITGFLIQHVSGGKGVGVTDQAVGGREEGGGVASNPIGDPITCF